MTATDDFPGHVGAKAFAVADRMASRMGPEGLEGEPEPGPDHPDLAAAAAHGMAEHRRVQWLHAIPSRFQWCTLDAFAPPAYDPRVLSALTEWTTTPDGRNLLVLGPTGTGKTSAAVAACRQLHEQGKQVRLYPVTELLDMLRPDGPPGALLDLCAVDVLIVDDLGTERPTDWTAERLYMVINRRWMEERPTVATSNLEPTALAEALGPRVYSRLTGNDAVGVRLTGDDRRKARR